MGYLGCRSGVLLILCIGTAWAGDSHAADPPESGASVIDRGAYLATAADCGACHTAPHGRPFAGGLAIDTPLGIIYSTNITPSKEYGIGRYAEQDFAQALRRGIRHDGANLYSAMPYNAYVKLTDEDVHALYEYFRQAVKAVDRSPPQTALPFPLNIRASMMAWNFLFLESTAYVPDPKQSTVWNRGAYLAQGAAHCSACHTPRGLLMQEEQSRALAGARVGPWYAPNITSDPVSGIGSWSKEELVSYLRTGYLSGKAQAAGSMGEAVEHSFQYLAESDLDAIATYVKNVPAVHDPADDAQRFSAGKLSSELGTLRGRGGISSDNDANPSGEQLFQGNCASCHAAEGQGSKDGYFPSLFHNSASGAKNATNLIAAVLYGVNRTTAKGQAFMPGFGGHANDANPLTDREVAALGNYVLAHYGSGTMSIDEQQVIEVRRGWPSSPLLLLARAGLAGAVLFVISSIVFILSRGRRKGSG